MRRKFVLYCRRIRCKTAEFDSLTSRDRVSAAGVGFVEVGLDCDLATWIGGQFHENYVLSMHFSICEQILVIYIIISPSITVNDEFTVWFAPVLNDCVKRGPIGTTLLLALFIMYVWCFVLFCLLCPVYSYKIIINAKIDWLLWFMSCIIYYVK